MFEITKRDGLARIGKLDTAHGILETPALLPVINPRLITISPKELHEVFGFQGLITNSYIIRNDPLLREKALNGKLHELLNFPGVIMTDSGTFQSHMYGEVAVRNDDIVNFQKDIGTDIGTVLDIFTEPEWSKEQTTEAVNVTLERTREAAGLKGNMMLAGVVQGSVYPDLREHCAREMASIAVDVHPIGGVVPLMEQYRFADLVDVIIASKKGLNPSRPVHLFGAGHPMIFSLAVLLGCDMFDSASYAKFARDDRLMTVEGTMHLADMKVQDCYCPACVGKTIEQIKTMKPAERTATLARHNLYTSLMEIERCKRAIAEGDIWELAERRCRSHPALLDGLRRLHEHTEYLEKFEPLSRDRAMFYTGPESLNRPVMLRYEKRFFSRYKQPSNEILVGFADNGKPYNRQYSSEISRISATSDAHFMVITPFGPVPIELDEMYPIAQSLFPRTTDRETDERIRELMERQSHRQTYKLSLMYDGEPTLEMLSEIAKGTSTFDLDAYRIRAVADYQFGEGAADALFSGKVELVKSKNTDKIRNIIVDGEHILSLRAEDGYYTMRPGAARRLMKAFPLPRLRVMVKDDAIPFVMEGKNTFCGFVLEADPELRPMDEVMVVDKNDKLLAIGRAILVPEEMKAMTKGIAVKVREGVKD
ncbi:MAG: tRNA guanosine(15) transglycosylase TgtA [Methanomassiliicoccales archaeon]|jgi:7-cyano-7-deazaguanine tRNA-ribosyltransferase